MVAVRGRQCPHDGADDQHEHGDDEHKGEQRADDLAQVTDAFEAVEVGEYVHARSAPHREGRMIEVPE